MRIAPLKSPEWVEEVSRYAQELATRGAVMKLKVATVPDAQVIERPMDGKPILVHKTMGHEFTGWRSVRNRVEVVTDRNCSVCLTSKPTAEMCGLLTRDYGAVCQQCAPRITCSRCHIADCPSYLPF